MTRPDDTGFFDALREDARRATDPARLARIHPRNSARLRELLAEKERRHNRLGRRIGRPLRGRRSRRAAR